MIFVLFQIRLDPRLSLESSQPNSEATNLRIKNLKLEDAGTLSSYYWLLKTKSFIKIFLLKIQVTTPVLLNGKDLPRNPSLWLILWSFFNLLKSANQEVVLYIINLDNAWCPLPSFPCLIISFCLLLITNC